MNREYTKIWFLLIIFILLFIHGAQAGGSEIQTVQGGEFEISHHELLPPINLVRKSLEPLRPDTERPQWEWVLESFGKNFQFDLESNDRLIGGLPKEQRERIAETVKLYRGKLQGNEDSWIRLTRIGDEWSGMFWDGEEIYIIDPITTLTPFLKIFPFIGEFKHGIYRLSDTRNLAQFACGVEGNEPPSDTLSDFQALSQELEEAVSVEAAGASLNIDLAIVTDPLFAQVQENSFNTSNDAAVVARVNVVDGIYSSQVGVQINLVQILELSSNGSLTSTDSGTLLTQFGNFTNSSSFNHPGVAHLFTGRNLNGSVIGRAYLSSLCSPRYGVGINEIRQGGTIGSVLFAHELGHNFGSPHDNQSGSTCASTPGTFIMSPVINNSQEFSECSIEQMQPEINSSSCITAINPDRPVSSVTLDADKTSPAPLATVGTVQWTATASGGSGSSEYQFWLRGPSGPWAMVQAYGPDNTFDWTPPSAGNWLLAVRARNQGSPAALEADTARFFQVINEAPVTPVTSVSLSANKTSPASLATVGTVQWTATASGGSGSSEYQFWLRDPSGTWAMVQAYGPDNTFGWTPPSAGNWLVAVRARNQGSPAVLEADTARFFQVINEAPVTSVSLSANKTSPASLATVGTVQWTATASGGSGSSEYQFWLRNPSGTWAMVQAYGPDNTFDWTPPSAGNWLVAVRARNQGSPAVLEADTASWFEIISP